MIKNCPYEKVEQKIRLHYGDEQLDQYRDLYNNLINMKLSPPAHGNLEVYIIAYREGKEEDIRVDEFDDDDTSLYFDVSGFSIEEKLVYSIEAASYSDFLQYSIDTKTLEHYKPENILAHCLHEITYWGFEDRK